MKFLSFNTCSLCKLFNITAFVSVFFLYAYSLPASAVQPSIRGVPLPEENCNKGINVKTYGTKSCWWTDAHSNDGVALFYGPTPVDGEKAGSYKLMADGFSTSYVPYSGLYRVRTHACPGTQAGNCTLGSSAQTFDSRNAVQLQSGAKIVDQTPDFGGGAGQLATSSTICFTFISDDGSEWSTSAKRTCQDAPRLPEKPSFCYLNSGVDLDVDMGTIERGMISTVPGSTTKKTVPLKVMCSGDAAATTTMKFEYTPVTIVGSEVVSADKAGLGVAIFIDDKLMTTKETVTQTFQPGVTTVNLGFEVVRDPYVNIGTIGTGSFNADAVMILTKQ